MKNHLKGGGVYFIAKIKLYLIHYNQKQSIILSLLLGDYPFGVFIRLKS